MGPAFSLKKRGIFAILRSSRMKEKSTKKDSCLKYSCCGCSLLVAGCLIVLLLLQSLTFLDIGLVGSFFRGLRSKKDEKNILFNASPPRNYPIQEPGSAVRSRKIDCDDLYWYTSDGPYPGKTLFCANLYAANEREIATVLEAKSAERIILYGENVFFDVTSHQAEMDAGYILNAAKFTDQVTVPTMMDIYGFSDLSFIGKSVAPYPALHIYLDHYDKINEGHELPFGGFAYGYFENTTGILRFTQFKPEKKTYYRPGSTDKVAISYAWPENCYISQDMIHEINHNFSQIKIKPDKDYFFYLPNWFEEQVGNVVWSMFPEYICGEGTIESFQSSIDDRTGNQNLVEFNSIMPPAPTYGKEDWFKTDCQKATMVSWYRFIGKGDFKTQFRKYATEMRKATKTTYLRDENNMAEFIANLDGTAAARNFLLEHGCRF